MLEVLLSLRPPPSVEVGTMSLLGGTMSNSDPSRVLTLPMVELVSTLAFVKVRAWEGPVDGGG
jgi:hypothetical protein